MAKQPQPVRAGPIRGPHQVALDQALAVDHERPRQAFAQPEGRGAVARRVEQQGQAANAQPLQVGLGDLVAVFVQVHRHHGQPLAAEHLLQFFQVRQFVQAGRAPGGPEVEQHHPATETVGGDDAAFLGRQPQDGGGGRGAHDGPRAPLAVEGRRQVVAGPGAERQARGDPGRQHATTGPGHQLADFTMGAAVSWLHSLIEPSYMRTFFLPSSSDCTNQPTEAQCPVLQKVTVSSSAVVPAAA